MIGKSLFGLALVGFLGSATASGCEYFDFTAERAMMQSIDEGWGLADARDFLCNKLTNDMMYRHALDDTPSFFTKMYGKEYAHCAVRKFENGLMWRSPQGDSIFDYKTGKINIPACEWAFDTLLANHTASRRRLYYFGSHVSHPSHSTTKSNVERVKAAVPKTADAPVEATDADPSNVENVPAVVPETAAAVEVSDTDPSNVETVPAETAAAVAAADADSSNVENIPAFVPEIITTPVGATDTEGSDADGDENVAAIVVPKSHTPAVRTRQRAFPGNNLETIAITMIQTVGVAAGLASPEVLGHST